MKNKQFLLFICAVFISSFLIAQETFQKVDRETHFTTVWSGNPFTPMTFMVSGAAINGEALQAGDEIGIFDGDKCVGAGVLESALDPTNPNDNISIAASKDDGGGNGFTEGNAITYKLWRASDETELVVEEPSYPYEGSDSEVFIGLATNFVILSQGGVPNPLEITSILVESPACYEGQDGSIVISAGGGVTPYEYSIDGGANWQSNYQFLDLGAGSYTVMVKDADGTEVSYGDNPVVLSNPVELVITEVASTNISEAGASDGSITITATGGTGVLSYTIDGGDTWESNSGVFTGMAAGNYDVGVKDENDCEQYYESNPVEITEPGGETHFTTVWSGNPFTPMTFMVSGAAINGEALQAGDEIGIFDGDKCVGAGVLESALDPTNPNDNISIAASKDDGGGNGFTEGNAITYKLWRASDETELVVEEPSYPYEGSDSEVFIGLATNFVILSQGGVPNPLEITSILVESPACYEGQDGSIVISAGGGVTPYEYSIDGGANWQSNYQFLDLGAGSYTVMVKDADGTEVSYGDNPVVLSNPVELVITEVASTNISEAGASDGSITITATGGTGVLSYTIDGGDTWESNSGVFTGMAAGNYDVGVKDENDCEQYYESNPVEITEPGGETHFTTVWSGNPFSPMTFFVSGADLDGEPLQAGDEIGIFDGDKCVGAAVLAEPIDAGDPQDFISISASKDDGSGNGFSDGNPIIYKLYDADQDLEIIVSEPIYPNPDFEFDNFQSMETALVLFSETSGDPIIIDDVLINDLQCYNSSDGQIIITASEGTPPFEYSIDNGVNYQESNEFNSLPAGDYYILVKDDVGLIEEYENNPVVLTQPEELLISEVTTQDISCYGGITGEIQVTATGGTPAYEYSIDGGETWQTAGDYTGLGVGTYNISVKDANGCITDYEQNPVELIQPEELLISEVATQDIGCYGSMAGEIQVTATGGTPAYEYSIDGGETWQTAGNYTGLGAGTYNISIKDANGCITDYEQNPVELTQPEELLISEVATQDIDCYGSVTGEIYITATGGTPDYEYSIDGGETWQADGGYTDLEIGIYNITIKDGNGCITDYDQNPVELTQPEELLITEVTTQDLECYGSLTGEIHITATGGTPAYEYSIDGGATWQTAGDYTGLGAGTYTVSVKDSNGCITDYEENPVELIQPEELLITDVVYDEPNCYSCNEGSITITATGGTGQLYYSIDGGETWSSEGLFELISAGEYQVMVSDENECLIEYENNPLIITQPGENTYYEPVWEGNPYNAMSVLITGVAIDGIDSDENLEIGLFDINENGELICIGVGMQSNINETNFLTIKASENDALLGDPQNGFIEGNEILYKIWDGEQEYTSIEKDYEEGFPSEYIPLETTAVQLNALSSREQEITLLTGWNMISMNVIPDNANMLDIIQPLIDNGTLIKMQDESGNSIQYLPWIGTWNNSIGDMSITEGYQVKMNSDDIFMVTGLPAEVPQDIPLTQGWNIMGYPPEYGQDALEAVQPLIDNGTLIKVQDETGSSIQYLPWIGIWNNSIGNFMPAEGYQVKLNSDDVLTINEGDIADGLSNKSILFDPVYFEPAYEGNPYQAMSLIIKAEYLSEFEFEMGDEIAAFDIDSDGNELCVGAKVIEHSLSNEQPIILIASMNDPLTDVQDGFISDKPIQLRIYDISEDSYYYPLGMDFNEDYNNTYTELGTSIIELNSILTEANAEGLHTGIKLNPNPAADKVVIELKTRADSQVDVMLFDGYSRIIENVYQGKAYYGYTKVINTQFLPSGIYFVKVTIDNQVYTEKLIIE